MKKQSQISLNIPKSDKPRLVIAGGGFGGIHLLRKLDLHKYQVILFDRYNYHTFQPLLYQVATAGLEPDSIAGPLRKVIHKKKDVHFRMLKIEEVDPENKEIHTAAGAFHYDFLIIATGAKINYFGNNLIAKNSFPLKQVTHALDLRSHIFQQFEELEISGNKESFIKAMNFVVVGAGPTGVEVCGAIAELKRHALPDDYPGLDFSNLKIHLIEGEDRVLPGMKERTSKKALEYLVKLGVNVVLNCRTESYEEQVVKLSNGEEITSGTLIWAAGVKGNVPKGFSDKSLQKGKLMVNSFNQVYSDRENNQVFQDVFAIGDVSYMDQEGYPNGLPGVAQVAIQQGKQLGRNLSALAKRKKLKEFYYKDKGEMATIGRNKAVADLKGNFSLYGLVGWFTWMLVHLLFLVGFRSKIVVFANWVWNYMTFERSIRIILRPSSKMKDKMSREMVQEMNEF